VSKSIKISARCLVRTSQELLGGKWKMLILHQVDQGLTRYGALKRGIPDISEKMLAQELHHLVDNHLLSRQEFREEHNRVEYQLTEAGQEALPLIRATFQFGNRYWEWRQKMESS